MASTKIRRRADRQLRSLPLLRNSERQSFKKCRWLWDITYNGKLRAKTAAPPLRFGTLIHQSFALYYTKGKRRGQNPVSTFEQLYEKDSEEAYKFGFRDEDGVWQEAGELGVAMLTKYLDTYGKDDEWEVLVTEQPYQQVVYHPTCGICNQIIFEGDCDPQCPGPHYVPWFKQVGVLDGVWRNRVTTRTIIVDHKTAGSISTGYLAMDDQAGSYWTWGVDWLYEKGLLKPSVKLDGMLFNFLRKAMPDERPKNEKGQFLNKDGSVSKKQPPDYFLRHYSWRDEFDRNMQRERAQAEFAEIEMVKQGVLKPYKAPSKPNCTGCWLLDACELHETGNDWEEFLRQTSMPWDPYDEHEIEAGR